MDQGLEVSYERSAETRTALGAEAVTYVMTVTAAAAGNLLGDGLRVAAHKGVEAFRKRFPAVQVTIESEEHGSSTDEAR
jgi:hypothetical protein